MAWVRAPGTPYERSLSGLNAFLSAFVQRRWVASVVELQSPAVDSRTGLWFGWRFGHVGLGFDAAS